VIFQWPERLSRESYEDLVDWTNLIFRKVERAVVSEQDGKPSAEEMLE
jgi:hypothetical protein